MQLSHGPETQHLETFKATAIVSLVELFLLEIDFQGLEHYWVQLLVEFIVHTSIVDLSAFGPKMLFQLIFDNIFVNLTLRVPELSCGIRHYSPFQRGKVRVGLPSDKLLPPKVDKGTNLPDVLGVFCELSVITLLRFGFLSEFGCLQSLQWLS